MSVQFRFAVNVVKDLLIIDKLTVDFSTLKKQAQINKHKRNNQNNKKPLNSENRRLKSPTECLF